MRARRSRPLRARRAILACALLGSAAARGQPGETTAEGALYVRTDTDSTTVVAPRAHVRHELAGVKTGIDVVYTADVWTSASVDIRTAATERVTEQRDELNLGLDRALADDHARIGIAYRFSHEPDFLSHAVALRGAYETPSRNTTLDARVFASVDAIGRAEDALFEERATGVGAWLGLSQLLDRDTVLQLAYELRARLGYQASPYRFVALDSPGLCTPAATWCVPEVLPRARHRNAWVVGLRRALHRRVSLGASYRFYVDTWALRSHTPLVDLAVSPARDVWLWLRYRGYFQSGASFYRARYQLGDDLRFVTRDRELSSMFSHRAELVLRYQRALGDRGARALSLGALLGGA
ncbi:MAG: DUF3570 domain-containing protein, partial [Myxococcales bacterium]|nr:DUF3570 domain-containing protein [Myxococcales bacterium]